MKLSYAGHFNLSHTLVLMFMYQAAYAFDHVSCFTQGMDKNYPCFRSFSHGKSDPEMKREETIIRHVINLDKDFWVTNL